MIAQNIVNSILQTGLLAFTIPVVAIVAWKIYSKSSLVPFFTGMLIFVAFAMVMESVPHMVFIRMDNPISRFLNKNVVAYAIYGSLMAALFEELGRYFAFRYLLVNHTGKETAVTYGIGHGGIENMILVGIAYIQYYAYALLINNGKVSKMLAAYQTDGGDNASVQTVKELISYIKHITLFSCYMVDLERICTTLLQISLSILVFEAVRIEGKKNMLYLAMLLHMLVDIPAALFQKKVLALLPTEICIAVLTVAIFLFTLRSYQTMEVSDQAREIENENRHRLHQMARQGFQQGKDSNKDK